MRGHAWTVTLLVGLVCQCLTPAHSFFFSPFFRRQSSPSPSPLPPLSSSRDHVVNGGEVTDQQATSSLRIANGPNPSFVYAPVTNQDFHVPKSLCIACEKFPWTPVAGSEQASISILNPSAGPPPPPQPYQQQLQQIDVAPDQPSVTVLVNSPQAQGVEKNRRPFAIQFDSSQTQNQIAHDQHPPLYEGPKQPTVLQPVGHAFHPTSRPAQFYRPSESQPPKPSPSTLQPVPLYVSYNNRPQQQQLPTILQPVKNGGYGVPPPTAPTQNYNLRPPGFQIFPNNGPPPPPSPSQSYGPPFSPLTAGTLVVAQQHQQQIQQQREFAHNSGFRIQGLRPPAPNGEQSHNSGFQIQGVQPAQLIYQEHTKVNGEPPQQYGKPSAPPPGIQVPIVSQQPFGTLNVKQIPVDSVPHRFTQSRHPNNGPQQSYGPPNQIKYGPPKPPPPPQNYGPPPPVSSSSPPQSYGPPQNLPPPPPSYGPPNLTPAEPLGPSQNQQQQQQQQQSYGPPPPPPPSQSYGPSPQNLSPPQSYGPPQNLPPPPQQGYGPPPKYRQNGNQRPFYTRFPPFVGPPQFQKPSFTYGPPPPNNNNNNNFGPALYILPQRPQQTLSLQMEAPPPPQNNLPLPPPPQQYGAPPQNGGQIFFPPQSTNNNKPDLPPLQLSAQYGPSQVNQGGDNLPSQPPAISIPYLLEIEPENRLPETGPEGYSSQQINVQRQKEPKIVPIPVPIPKYVGSESQASSFNFVPSPQKTTFSPQIVGKDIGDANEGNKNPFLQSSSADNQQKEGLDKNVLRLEGKGQRLKGGWEIIPATQYDITHLFQNPGQASITIDSQNHRQPVPDPLPIPVPFPVSVSPSAKSPIFVVSEQPHSQFSVSAGASLESSETQNNKQVEQGSSSVQSQVKAVAEDEPSNEKSQPPSPQPSPLSFVTPIQSLPIKGRPYGIPIVQASQVQQHKTHFDPLPPSIVTALHHAQRTSFLTHSHLVSQPQPTPESNQQQQQQTVYINSVPVLEGSANDIRYPQGQQLSEADKNKEENLQNVDDGGRESNRLENAKAIGQFSGNGGVPGYQGVPYSCRHHQMGIPPFGQNIQQQIQGRDRPYLFYYPTPVQQSSVYWVERPTSQSGPFSTLAPLPTAQTFEASKEPSGSETVFSPPVFGWSPKIVQTFNPFTPESSSSYLEQKEKVVGPTQKTEGSTTRQPFDIISLGAETIVDEDDKVQSLENIDTTTTTTTGRVPTSSTNYIRPVPFRPTPSVQTEAESLRHSDYQTTTTTTLKNFDSSEFKPSKTYTRPKTPKLVEESSKLYTEISGSTTTADCITDVTTEQSIDTTTSSPIVYNSPRVKNGGPEKIRLRVGARFPAGRPAIASSSVEPTSATSGLSSIPVSSIPGSTAVPVYRPITYPYQNTLRESSEASESILQPKSTLGTTSTPSDPTPINLLTFGDIYKNSETKQGVEGNVGSVVSTSTEQSASFSVSVDSSSSMSTSSSSSSSFGERERTSPRKLYSPDEVTALGSDQLTRVSHISSTTPLSVGSFDSASSTDVENGLSRPSDSSSSSTFSPSPSMATSTKIVKTVRVRQRMRPGQGGPSRSRFTHGHGGRVRVVQRPVTQEYIKNFPEFAQPEGETLGKEEQEEVKNALIDLKKI